MQITRALSLLALPLLFLASPQATRGQSTQPAADAAIDPNLGMSTLVLWPHGAPGAKGTTAADTPTLTVFRPVRPNGTAVIVIPGGAYIHLAANHEGREPADRLSELGITTFVLRYRLGPTYLYPAPLDDARRAVRLVRSLASTYGYSPDRIGMLGFSAGGHLTAMTGVQADDGLAGDPDPVQRQSARLNFMILGYPWLNAMQPPVPNPYQPGKDYINYCSVTKGLTQADCARLDPQYTPEAHVSAATPPTFIVHTADDATVPVLTSVGFFTAMHKAGAMCELHILAHGPHGFGPGGDNPALAGWLDTLTLWLRARGLLTPAAAAATH